MKCTNCGRDIGPGAIFCTGCGMKVSDMKNDGAENTQAQEQSQQQNQQYQSVENQQFNANNYGYNPNGSMNMGYNPNVGMGMAVNQFPTYSTYIDKNGKRVPAEYKPITAWGYFGYNILFAIPFVGFIFLLIYALGGNSNVNLRNYARSFFCIYAIALIILLLAFVFAAILGASGS